MATAAIAQPSAAAAGPSSSIASTSTSSIPRVRKGQKIEDALAAPSELPPSVQYIDSPFQLQEYLSLLLRKDPHDVERIVRIPEADVSRIFEETPKGKEKEVGASYVDEELHPIDTDVWVYEQLRRLVLDFSTPWLTSLQRECSKTKNPTTCDAMNAGDWMYLCASHGEEKECCAIDYIIHTLDGTTALLNSARHFPSRTYIPTTSLRHFGSISRRLNRIFMHAKDHHKDIFDECESETSLYARFYMLCKMYDLIAIESLFAPPSLTSLESSESRSSTTSSSPQDGTEQKRILRRESGKEGTDEDGNLKRTDTTVSRKPRESVGGRAKTSQAEARESEEGGEAEVEEVAKDEV